MLDPKILRSEEGRALIEAELEKRNLTSLLPDVAKIFSLDERIRKNQIKIDRARQERNLIADQVAQADEITRAKFIKQGRKIGAQIKKLDERQRQLKNKFDDLFALIPNISDERLPIGGEEQNLVMAEYGTKREFDFTPQTHSEIFERMGWLRREQASKLAGARFNYLLGDLVKLEFAFFHWLMDWLVNEEGFIPVLPPVLVKEQALFGAGNFPQGRNDVFSVSNPAGEDELFLSGTAEIQLASLHAGEILTLAQPLRYCAFSTNFRREAGAAGKDTQGITRQHQFNKIEMFIYTRPEDSEKELQDLIERENRIIEALDLPYRVVLLATADNPTKFSITYDHEIWLPGENTWREVQSASNALEYQARRLNIRYRQSDNKTAYAHTLNGTAGTERFLIAIVENYQQQDGTIILPEVLHPYYHGEPILKPLH